MGGCLWRDGFRLDDAIRPPFVTPALAEALLRAGKSLNFLRECCGDTAFEQSLAASPLAAAAAQLSYGKVGAFSYGEPGITLISHGVPWLARALKEPDKRIAVIQQKYADQGPLCFASVSTRTL